MRCKQCKEARAKPAVCVHHMVERARRNLGNHNAKRRYCRNGREVAEWTRDRERLQRALDAAEARR